MADKHTTIEFEKFLNSSRNGISETDLAKATKIIDQGPISVRPNHQVLYLVEDEDE